MALFRYYNCWNSLECFRFPLWKLVYRNPNNGYRNVCAQLWFSALSRTVISCLLPKLFTWILKKKKRKKKKQDFDWVFKHYYCCIAFLLYNSAFSLEDPNPKFASGYGPELSAWMGDGRRSIPCLPAQWLICTKRKNKAWSVVPKKHLPQSHSFHQFQVQVCL